MSGSQTEEIKARLDIVEFIQSYVRLDKAGINFKACCPFHSEKTPSFFVSPSRQTWHCFGGCGEGGDIFKFVMKIEGLEFPEALRLLGARAGVTITRENPALRSARNRLYDVCEAAAHIYERALLTTPAPKEYLKARGIKEETVRAFRIGYVPDEWDFVLKGLARKGFTAEDAEHAGLALRSEGTSRRHDRFRSRIMFPIADANGRVIGFGGRIFEETRDKRQETSSSSAVSHIAEVHVAKYINSPQTLIYDKSRVLYGFDRAKQEIRAKNRAVVVEGYMDCVMSHQAGIAHTIAVSGTAFTATQLKVLRRLCDTLVSSFDADAAGESATRRSLALAAQFDFTRLIAAIPSGKDPADTVKDDPASWRAAVEDAKPMVAFYFDQVFGREDPETAEGKKKISSALLPFVAELSDEIEKAHWIAELAQKLNVPEGQATVAPTSAPKNLTPTKVMAPKMTIDKDKFYSATLKTSEGDITIELSADKTPITVNNFIYL
ncbi:MAG: DNA primase, partial [Candidatus Sungbacteria bacterium]|nr:DNA primase [Candidatus Sungbacteria bacterium]